MRIFRLIAGGEDRKYCFVKGAFAYHVSLNQGHPILQEMKEDGGDALEYHLDEVKGGLKIGDYFRTTTNHLPVSRKFAEAVAANFNLGPYEFVPARIKNEKGRIHVPDMVIVNPLQAEDCLDWERSEMDGDTENPLVRIYGKWSLKLARIPKERDLFRVKALIGYLFSERLVSFIRDKKFENFKFEDAPLS
jgi:hypothetical protein